MKIIKQISISFLTILIVLLLIASCKEKSKEINSSKVVYNQQLNNGKELMEQKCNICHAVNTKTHDDIIAPPMIAVKRRYSRFYNSEKEFVEGITNWVLNPNEKDALMYGAVQQYKVMPKLPYTKEEVKAIANYIYNNELEKPSWFQQHFNEEHKSGKGRGNGFRNGNGQNHGKNRF